MQIEIVFKSPDSVDQAVQDAAEHEFGYPDLDDPDTGDEDTQSVNAARVEILTVLKKWLRFNESITVVFDTEAGTATVKEQNA